MNLSVVVPTMNKVDLLRQTLKALQEQVVSDKWTWEVVVVNDGSTDGTAGFLSEIEDTGQNPKFRTASPPHNVGRAKARNWGARAAKGDSILFMDDDIVAPAGLVESHLKLLTENPGFGTIGYAITAPEVNDAPHFSYLDSRGVAKLTDGQAPGRFFVTQNAAVPRQAFLDIGGFDEDFSSYGFEDMEVAFRLEEQAQIQFLALTHPVPMHVHHHTLDEYLEKKIECGRHSLPHLAQLHPHRIVEMKLHHVVDYPGQKGVGALSRLIRFLSRNSVKTILKAPLRNWPVGHGQQPFLPSIHHRLMDLLVLICFRQGVMDGDRS
ncbi:MAG: glycosyltransferase family 2 protein [bacterium]|nr:glycosyltransferase family 2 protein [bacterium]